MSYVDYLDPQIASIGAALIAAIAALIVADQRPKRRVQSVRVDDRAWIDERIAAETDPARRAAWRIIRDQPEGD